MFTDSREIALYNFLNAFHILMLCFQRKPPMKFDPKTHHRHSIRLKGYDYSQSGAYFVTLVTWQRECLFGEVVNGEMRLNRMGKIVEQAWFDLPRHYRHLELGAFVVMPNHAHGILILHDESRGGSLLSGESVLPESTHASQISTPDNQTRPYSVPKRHPLSEIVRALKSFSAKRINVWRHAEGLSVWQRNYFEHIIRNEREMENIWLYIESNPARWNEDAENPAKG